MKNIEKVSLQSNIMCWIDQYCEENGLDEKKMEEFFENKIENYFKS